MPDSVREIGDCAFYGCTLDEFHFPNSLERIGEGAFQRCSIYTRYENDRYYLDFPSSLKSIGKDAFMSAYFDWEYNGGNEKMFAGDINLQNTCIEVIPENAFQNWNQCKPIKRLYDGEVRIFLPNTVLKIEREAFYDSGFTEVVMQEGIETIDERAFVGANRLMTLNLPSTIKSIGDDAFSWLGEYSKINRIRIPANVTSIGEDICDRVKITLEVEPGSYAEIWASENGYITTTAYEDDISWLN